MTYLRCIVAGVVVLLAAAGFVLVAGGASTVFLVGTLLLLVPVALNIGGGFVDLHQILLARRLPPPPYLSGPPVAAALAATAIVHPVIVYSDADVTALVDSIRTARAAAGGGFALHLALVDFADGPTPTMERDEYFRAAIDAAVATLNAERPTPPVAALFRRRRWADGEGCYLGWERKRGKLAELAELIAGSDDTSFDPAKHDLAGIRYLLTLDVGNRLRARGARRLVATIAHPDNAAVIDTDGIVSSGYVFVRPTHVTAVPTTWFEWAVHPYRTPEAMPPPAQSAFGQDAFLGQGVIDVAGYRAVLSGRIPQGRVLSHDKLEGMHGRTAAIADARVTEAAMPDYLLFRRREHRWIRGDTHLLPWIVTTGRRTLRGLPFADRAQMARDILGHAYPVSIVALLAVGWLAVPVGQVGWWTGTVLAMLLVPVLMMGLMPVVAATRLVAGQRRDARDGRRWRWSLIARETVRPAVFFATVELVRVLVWLPLLADRAVVAFDALARATYRTTVSHRNVLRWTSSVRAGRIEPGLGTRYGQMWPSCAVALLLGVATVLSGPTRTVWAAPLLVVWLAGPLVAYRTARPAKRLPRSTP